MKKNITLLFLFLSLINYSQDKRIDAKITSVSYTVNNSEEFDTIDWKEIKEIFSKKKRR
ncbi:hypothetical protein [Polaribacter porphyrae]|uniref:hypothetical protein n=1 Tax=Polaribacter porphyrae TaxID=1137780 RepID=UPI0014731F84|nr:hypothetical protein [Polaribacter porphyrae]